VCWVEVYHLPVCWHRSPSWNHGSILSNSSHMDISHSAMGSLKQEGVCARFDVLTPVTAKGTTFWDVTPCSHTEVCRFGLTLAGYSKKSAHFYRITWHYIPGNKS
jgi:hypothetical protein